MSTRSIRLAALAGAVALVAASCGSGVDDPAALPIDDGYGAPPPAAGACLAGEPDCQDTGGDPAASPLPPPGNGEPAPVASDGMAANGGLTVSEALATDATGILGVQGFLFDDGSGPVLCEALAESYPPQCGGASIPVTGHDEVVDVPLQNAQGVSWTDQTIAVFGQIIDGTLTVDPTVTG